MTKELLSQKEKELIAVGGSVAAGCVKCSHYHFRQAFEQGASQDEVLRAVIEATAVINDSVVILQRTAYELMDVEVERASESGRFLQPGAANSASPLEITDPQIR